MSTENTTAIAEYSPTQAALADIARRMSKVVYDVSTPAGMAAAKKDRAEVRDLRVALEKKRVEIKAPALKRCKEIDTEAARITAALLAYETPPDLAIKAEEDRLEAIRQAKILAEQERQAAIQKRIADIRAYVVSGSKCKTAAQIAKLIEDLHAVIIDDSFGDFQTNAMIEQDGAIQSLTEMLEAANAREELEEKNRKERAELDHRRAEQAEKERKAAEDRAAIERLTAQMNERLAELYGNQNLTASCGSELIAEHISDLEALPVSEAIFGAYLPKAIEAKMVGLNRLRALHMAAVDHENEQARQAAERERQRVESERIAADRRDLEARQQAERDAIAARERAETEAREKKEREEDEARARNFCPTLDDIVSAVADHYNVGEHKAREWILSAVSLERAAA